MENSMFAEIDRFVSKFIQLTEEEWQTFHSLLKHKKIRKKNFLLQEGEVCDFEAYVIKGCLRTYYLDKEGIETILLFQVEDWWVGDISSFADRTPSRLFVETIEDCELLYFDYQSKALLYEKVPKFEKLFRILVQRSLGVFQQRFYAAVSQTAEERYLSFIEKYPQILQRVPQRQIARYIGVSPEFLSKVRGTMSKKA